MEVPSLGISPQAEPILRDYLLCFLKEIPDVFQWLRGGALGQDISDLVDFFLHRVHGLSVRPNHPADLQGLRFLQELLGPIGQLGDDRIPESKAVVAGSAVWEDARVPSRALVTARTLDPLDTDALASGLVTLWCLNAPGVTIAGWKGNSTGSSTRAQTSATRLGIWKPWSRIHQRLSERPGQRRPPTQALP